MTASLFERAGHCLYCADVDEKLRLTQDAANAFRAVRDTPAELAMLDPRADPSPRGPDAPGRPSRPRLVSPRCLPQRGLGTPQGRAALVHAVAHIEFNAVNLAWDAAYRFLDMPVGYYRDWVEVASDEARHFALLRGRLRELGHEYGDFDAHDGLWEMARKTAESCLERMALVPRVLEARGLDVTPGMIARLAGVRDDATVAILETILREEVAHVAAGSRWFAHCCQRAGVEPETTFRLLVARHGAGVRPPFNRPARLQAGFSAGEMDVFEAGSAAVGPA